MLALGVTLNGSAFAQDEGAEPARKPSVEAPALTGITIDGPRPVPQRTLLTSNSTRSTGAVVMTVTGKSP